MIFKFILFIIFSSCIKKKKEFKLRPTEYYTISNEPIKYTKAQLLDDLISEYSPKILNIFRQNDCLKLKDSIKSILATRENVKTVKMYIELRKIYFIYFISLLPRNNNQFSIILEEEIKRTIEKIKKEMDSTEEEETRENKSVLKYFSSIPPKIFYKGYPNSGMMKKHIEKAIKIGIKLGCDNYLFQQFLFYQKITDSRSNGTKEIVNRMNIFGEILNIRDINYIHVLNDDFNSNDEIKNSILNLYSKIKKFERQKIVINVLYFQERAIEKLMKCFPYFSILTVKTLERKFSEEENLFLKNGKIDNFDFFNELKIKFQKLSNEKGIEIKLLLIEIPYNPNMTVKKIKNGDDKTLDDDEKILDYNNLIANYTYTAKENFFSKLKFVFGDNIEIIQNKKEIVFPFFDNIEKSIYNFLSNTFEGDIINKSRRNDIVNVNYDLFSNKTVNKEEITSKTIIKGIKHKKNKKKTGICTEKNNQQRNEIKSILSEDDNDFQKILDCDDRDHKKKESSQIEIYDHTTNLIEEEVSIKDVSELNVEINVSKVIEVKEYFKPDKELEKKCDTILEQPNDNETDVSEKMETKQNNFEKNNLQILNDINSQECSSISEIKDIEVISNEIENKIENSSIDMHKENDKKPESEIENSSIDMHKENDKKPMNKIENSSIDMHKENDKKPMNKSDILSKNRLSLQDVLNDEFKIVKNKRKHLKNESHWYKTQKKNLNNFVPIFNQSELFNYEKCRNLEHRNKKFWHEKKNYKSINKKTTINSRDREQLTKDQFLSAMLEIDSKLIDDATKRTAKKELLEIYIRDNIKGKKFKNYDEQLDYETIFLINTSNDMLNKNIKLF